MRVLFLNYEYPPLGGGAGNATFYILKEFSKIKNLEMDLVTSSPDSEYHIQKVGEHINIHQLPIGKNKENLHFQSKIDLLRYIWSAYFFTRKLAKEKKYDLSHSFFTVPCGFLSLLLKWNFNIPYIISLRGSDVPGYSERFIYLYFFIKPLTRLIWKRSSAVIANSRGLKELALKTNNAQPIEVIYNGIEVNEFFPRHEAVSSEKFTVLCVSRITPRKGIRYLINAVAKLAPKYPQLRLNIIGEGNEKEALEKLTKELNLEKIVNFLGRVDHHRIASCYQDAYVFVLPSLNEGMSNTMLEALASGLPLLATNTGGTKELLDDGQNGFLVKMRDSEDLAEKIELIIKNKELQTEMSKKSLVKAKNTSWTKIAEEYLQIYNRSKL